MIVISLLTLIGILICYRQESIELERTNQWLAAMLDKKEGL